MEMTDEELCEMLTQMNMLVPEMTLRDRGCLVNLVRIHQKSSREFTTDERQLAYSLGKRYCFIMPDTLQD